MEIKQRTMDKTRKKLFSFLDFRRVVDVEYFLLGITHLGMTH
jgi:hypothetical protein